MDGDVVGSILLGGAITLVTSIVISWFSFSIQRNAQIKDRKTVKAGHALCGFHKIVASANRILNLKKSIDDSFRNAEEQGLGHLEPWQKVLTLVGARYVTPPLLPEEFGFLYGTKSEDLVSRIELLQVKAHNFDIVIDQYNQLRKELKVFLESNLSAIEVGEGTEASFTLEGDSGRLANLKIRAVANLLGQLIEQLEEDAVESKRLVELFYQKAREVLGLNFPKYELSGRTNDLCV